MHPMTQPSNAAPAPPALAGIRVLDLSRVLAGPWCTMVLADLGAEVIKIESPERGDDTRHWGPPSIAGESAYFLSANRNKKSVAVDLSTPEGQAAVFALARRADVLVENFKLGGADRFGLGYEAVARENPGIVYCSISGYGRASPLAERPGYDFVIQAEGGLMSITGEPGGQPMKTGVAVADLFTGMAAVQAILAALIARTRDGVGQHIDLALYDCQLSMLANVGSSHLVSGQEPVRYGNGHPTIVPYQTFAASDGAIVVAVGNDCQFQDLCVLLGCPELPVDPRFAANGCRVVNRDALIGQLAAVFIRENAAHWLQRMDAAGIPSGRVRQVGEALAAPVAIARGMVQTVEHPTAGPIRLVASPLKLSRTPTVAPEAPPTLGADTAEILAGIAADRPAATIHGQPEKQGSPGKVERAAGPGRPYG